MAKILLVGRIGAEPQLKETKNGKQFLIYKVATTDPYVPPKEGEADNEQTTSWHTIFAYGQAVEKLTTLEVGSLVHVEASFTVVKSKTESGEYKDTIYNHHQRLSVLKRPAKPIGESE